MSGFIHNIRMSFGFLEADLIKKFNNLTRKINKVENRLFFLHKCKELNILPNFIKNSVHNICNNITNCKAKHKLDYSRSKFSAAILNCNISDAHHSLKNMLHIKSLIISDLMDAFPSEIFYFIIIKNNEAYYKMKKRLKSQAWNKINKIKNDLLKKSILNNILTNYANWIINLTNHQIDERILAILALGKNFSFKSNSDYVHQQLLFDMISNTMTAIKYNTLVDRQDIQQRILKLLIAFNNKHKHTRLTLAETELLKWIKLTRSFVKNNPKLIVTTSDKGNKTVIMYKDDYDVKAAAILNDASTYKKLTKNPVNLFDKKIKTFLKKVNLTDLTIQNPSAGRMYFQPKIHKPGIPLRQITSTIDTSTYRLAKYLSQILVKVIDSNNSNVKNSFQLRDKLKTLKLKPQHRLFSLDVAALFPSIPQDLVMECVKQRWSEITIWTEFTLADFLEGLKLCFEGSFFSFQHKFYQQIQGCPMGSSLSGCLADLVLQKLETDISKMVAFKIIFFTRYVDDVLVIADDDQINNIFKFVNEFHPQLIFTIELESQASINFLDMKIIRNNNTLLTNWFRKDISSGRYLNYYSYTNIKFKTSVINALTDRAIRLADNIFHKENLQVVRDLLLKNSYPRSFIDKTINRRLMKIIHTKPHIPIFGPEPLLQFCKVPYHHQLNKGLHTILKDTNIRLTNGSSSTLSNCFTKTKDQIDVMDTKNTVYEISCGVCTKKYVGQSSQPLKKRIYQHKYNCHLLNQYHSGLCQHYVNTGHKFNFKDTRILQREQNLNKRLILETLHINSKSNRGNNVNNITNYDSVMDYFKPLLDNLHG